MHHRLGMGKGLYDTTEALFEAEKAFHSSGFLPETSISIHKTLIGIPFSLRSSITLDTTLTANHIENKVMDFTVSGLTDSSYFLCPASPIPHRLCPGQLATHPSL